MPAHDSGMISPPNSATSHWTGRTNVVSPQPQRCDFGHAIEHGPQREAEPETADQHPPRLRCFLVDNRWSRGGTLWRRGFGRQSNDEFRSTTKPATRNRNLSTVKLGQSANDRQANAQAAFRPVQ